ncbi:MAG: PfkB family carbohydrate kinase [Roseburia sp.]|nr:PfkB family carbohydrate kinase [Roseburia sp.]
MKAIVIGEINLGIALDAAGATLGALPGGLMARVAMALAADGVATVMASDAGADSPGDIAVNAIAAAGASVTSVDRFTEGRTPLNVLMGMPPVLTRYDEYPDEAFDIIWPRIDEGDIVVFGGHYALDARMRPRLHKLLAHATERKAVLVYVPDFKPQLQPRITRVMPEILENLEMAHLTVTTSSDLHNIFGVDTGAGCYADRISFYCRSLINIDTDCHALEFFAGKEATRVDTGTAPLAAIIWRAGALAGLAAALAKAEVTSQLFEAPSEAMRKDVLTAMVDSGHKASEGALPWQLFF